MIKYFCDRCGKEIASTKTIALGKITLGGLELCKDCYHKCNEVKDRVSDADFIKMSDKELQPYRCDFKVGDKVIDKYVRAGKIIDICTCERCRERGFFEPTVQYDDGSTDYIMRYDWETGFKSYYQIGNYIFGNLDEESVRKEIDECKRRTLQLYNQLNTIHVMKMTHQHKKKEIL